MTSLRQFAGAPLVEVVAAAIIREGAVLAARRSRPAELAGGWEFPGGKLEAGEDAPTALVRELREELGVSARVGSALGEASDGRIRLVLHVAALDGGEPRAQDEHDELRWLSPGQLDDVAWLPIDRALLAAVFEHLSGS